MSTSGIIAPPLYKKVSFTPYCTNLLKISFHYWNTLEFLNRKQFRFLHVSTDEVFGDLYHKKKLFNENTSYNPSSAYSASKASSDHLMKAWNRTYNFPVMITNCSNNYGPFQYKEKLIPLVIDRALSNKKIPVYGKGLQIRDWLYVDDHARALELVFKKGKIGNSYNIGGNNQIRNININIFLMIYIIF